MALHYTRKKEDVPQEKTVSASEFIERLIAIPRGEDRLPEIPNTEISK